jgi:DNA repair protein RadD
MRESYSIISMLTSRSKHGNFFKDILHITQIQEMGQFWTPLVYDSPKFDTKGLQYNSTKAEFTDESIKASYEKNDLANKILQKIEEHPERKRILVFVPSVDKAKELVEKIPGSACVWSGMPDKERDKVISDFRAGRLRVAINVNILSVGFDEPQIDMIMLARATASLSLYYQQVGRGVRPFSLKKDCLIVDLVGNTKKFGKVEHLYFKKEKRSWKLFGEGDKQLTGVPIHQIGEVTDEKKIRNQIYQKSLVTSDVKFTFGKYEGKVVSDAPDWYLDWLIQNIDWKHDQIQLESEVNRVRQLRKLKV